MSDNQENLEELLKSMVEVKGYKYPLSVCSFAMDRLPNLTEINSLTGKSFRLPSKDELRYILSEVSGLRDRLDFSRNVRYEVCQINGDNVLMNTNSGELENEVYIAPMRGESYSHGTPRCYRIVESDICPAQVDDPEYDELLRRKEIDQEIQDEQDRLYAMWDH